MTRLRGFLLGALALAVLSGCGVKGEPIAPAASRSIYLTP
jgi:predicted small lipoprotein YifL